MVYGWYACSQATALVTSANGDTYYTIQGMVMVRTQSYVLTGQHKAVLIQQLVIMIQLQYVMMEVVVMDLLLIYRFIPTINVVLFMLNI